MAQVFVGDVVHGGRRRRDRYTGVEAAYPLEYVSLRRDLDDGQFDDAVLRHGQTGGLQVQEDQRAVE